MTPFTREAIMTAVIEAGAEVLGVEASDLADNRP
jgi:hypothetical protein